MPAYLLTYTPPAPSLLTPEERRILDLAQHTGELYLKTSVEETGLAPQLRIDVWTGRTLGFLHGYRGHVLRS